MKNKNSVYVASLLILSIGLFACNESEISNADDFDQISKIHRDNCETSECFRARLEKTQQEIQNLSQGCSVASDCRIVALDFICNKSYTSILKSEIETYDEMVENFEKALASQETVGFVCTMEWFPTYDRNNYESQCVENQCEAIYIGPDDDTLQ